MLLAERPAGYTIDIRKLLSSMQRHHQGSPEDMTQYALDKQASQKISNQSIGWCSAFNNIDYVVQ